MDGRVPSWQNRPMERKAQPPMRIVDIAEFLGVSKQRAHQLVQSPGFPEPWTSTDLGRLWRRRNIEVWAQRNWWGSRPWRNRHTEFRR